MSVPTPIAIVGIGCRFSGGADSPEKFWKLLATGKSTWTHVPEERWNNAAFFDADPEQQGMHNTKGAHFLENDISAFDGGFWGLAPTECEAMDPQHRIQLEVAYEALENAGIRREQVEGSNTAVYIGTFSEDYRSMQQKDINDVPRYHTIGIGTSIAANRISYQLDLRGPSVTIDTGCSGSLVAVHQACQSLKTGECSLALAGGVNLLLDPDQIVTMSLMRCFSEEGKCFSFDSRGSGYGRGEGAAIVALKRLDDALRDGDPIRAIIKGSGVGQDGKTNGIMVPNSEAQKSLIKSVYQEAQLSLKDTPVIEAHGTGTAVGDPLEVEAIQRAFRESGPLQKPLYIGSVKPNIGHLESASGIAGLIKGVLMLEHEKIPATIGIESLKPNLQLTDFGIEIPNQLIDWPLDSPRRLSLNNFGYGGTNAHVIIEGAPRKYDNVRGVPLSNGSGSLNGQGTKPSLGILGAHTNGHHHDLTEYAHTHLRPQIIALSADSKGGASKLFENLVHWATSHPRSEEAFEDLAYTLTSRRSSMRHRFAIPTRSLAELCNASFSPKKSVASPQVVFAFTGQGAQWYGMGRELMSLSSPFRSSLQKSDEILRALGAGWSLIEELSRDKDTSKLNESELSQPATCAVQIALVDLLAHVGVTPHAVVGHSSGEIAAAYAAAILNQTSALAVAWFRGRCTTGKSLRKGAMLTVGLDEDEATAIVNKTSNGQAVVACVNSPVSTTISGDEEVIDLIEAGLRAGGTFVRKLQVDKAYHSPHMRDVAEGYYWSIRNIPSSSPRKGTRFISSVTGQDVSLALPTQYWVDNLTSKVRFSEAIRCAFRNQPSDFKSSRQIIVEIGPHSALAGPIRQTLCKVAPSEAFSHHSTLVRSRDAIETFSNLAAELFVEGCAVQLDIVNSILRPHRHTKVLTSLPPYPWNHSTKYWHESRLSKEHRFRKYPYHDLLGIQLPGQSSSRPIWRHVFSLSRLPWLQQHMINGKILFPASGYVAMVLEGMKQTMKDSTRAMNMIKYELKDVDFLAPFFVPESGSAVELQLQFNPVRGSQWEDFQIHGIDSSGTFTEHCRGSAMVLALTDTDEVEISQELNVLRHSCIQDLELTESFLFNEVKGEDFYNRLEAKGNSYGPHFACMQDIRVGSEQALATFLIPNVSECMPAATMRSHVIHPALLDAFFHPSVTLASPGDHNRSFVTASIHHLTISSAIQDIPGAKLRSHTRLSDQWARSSVADIDVFQFSGEGALEPVIHIEGLRLQALGSSDMTLSSDRANQSYIMEWRPDANFLRSSDIRSRKTAINEVSKSQAHKLHILNQASALYIDICLRKLKRTQQFNVIEPYQRFLSWMQRFQSSEEFRILVDMQEIVEVDPILKTCSSLGVEGEVLAVIGENLEPILSGEIDPLSLFTERDLLWRLYADDASVRCYGYAIEYLRHLIFKNPQMSVIEIGAGTGGATEPILAALSQGSRFPFKSYEFTDVSAAFFERSGKRLQKWRNHINYRKLDLQLDPMDQGFQAHSYDLVVASNVLHVAHSIDESLARIQKLLKPGGRILMVETTKTVPFLNTAIGVLPGWWAAQDGRADGPLLTEDEWDAAFKRTGLGGSSVVVKDFEGPAHRCSLIVSKPYVVPESSKARRPVVIVKSSHCESRNPAVTESLVTTLQSQGRPVITQPLETVDLSLDKVYVLLDDGSEPILRSKDGKVFQAMTRLVLSSISVVWVSVQDNSSSANNPEKGLATGLARVARIENPLLRITTLDIQDAIRDEGSRDFFTQVVSNLLDSLDLSCVANVAIELDCVLKNSQLLIPRVIPNQEINETVAKSFGSGPFQLQPFHQSDRTLCLSLDKVRVIDKMDFHASNSSYVVQPDEIEVIVQAFGINFKDVLIAGGHPKKKLAMAGEFAGTVVGIGSKVGSQVALGDRVCGFGATPYASRVRVQANTVARLPDSLSTTAGASIPVVFATAYHALVDIGRLEKGQSILVHSAAGGVGQAAISIAKWLGATIFATVSNASKKDFLINEAGIAEDHIFSSKLKSFKHGIKRLTNGQGVDLVLNSLSGQMLQDSLECLARFGTFVELGKTDIHTGSRISLSRFDLGITVASVDLSLLQEHRPQKCGDLIRRVVRMISERSLQLPGYTVKPMEHISNVFRDLQRRSHIGKFVLDAGSDAKVIAPAREEISALPSDRTYIIAGGRSGLGFEIGKHLARQGARYIVLMSRRTVTTQEQERMANVFRDSGANVRVLQCDITDEEAIKTDLLGALKEFPPVQGVIQSSLVVRDRMLSDLSVGDFSLCTAPKIDGTQNLIEALENQPLQFFIMLSSVVGGILGTLAEGSYAAANAYMNRLALSRRGDKTRFVAVCPGIIEDVGVVANDTKAKDQLRRQGFLNMKSSEVLALVNYALRKDCTHSEILSGFDYQSLIKSERQDAIDNPLFSHLPRLEEIVRAKASEKGSDGIGASVSNASSLDDARALIEQAIANKIRTLVAQTDDGIDTSQKVADLGVDSLALVELRNWIVQIFQARLQNGEIFDSLSITALARLVAFRSPLVTLKQETSDTFIPVSDGTTKESNAMPYEPDLAKQPLPGLDASLELWITAMKSALSETELVEARRLVENLRKPGGLGRKLQARLEALAADPKVDNWQYEMYNKFHYLKMRTPLIPEQNFAGTQYNRKGHSASVQSAIIASSCYNFSQRLERGDVHHQIDRGRKLEKDQYAWFFNATREPRKGEDMMVKYPSRPYLVAFRRGWAFKVRLDVTFIELEAQFQKIIDSPCEPESWVGVLTTDDRDTWAESRQLLRDVSKRNAGWLKTIEAASFVMYLDDARPETPRARGYQFLCSGFNRWSDKTIQFAVCDNGCSATMGEHGMIDGLAARRLHTFVQEAIDNHTPDVSAHEGFTQDTLLESYAFETSPELEKRIAAAKVNIRERVSDNVHSAFEIHSLNADLFRRSKIPPLSGVQMTIQLASRNYFGYNPIALETVGLAQFIKGRVECSHTVWPEVRSFCNAVASDQEVPKVVLREQLFDAIRSHANKLLRSAQGHGIDRHLLSLEWSIREGEAVPEFFSSALYKSSRPKYLMTDCLDTGAMEAHYLPAHRDGFWVHFEPNDTGVRFSIWGKEKNVERFEKIIIDSARKVRDIIVA